MDVICTTSTCSCKLVFFTAVTQKEVFQSSRVYSRHFDFDRLANCGFVRTIKFASKKRKYLVCDSFT